MTDIRRHLSPILSTLRQFLSTSGEDVSGLVHDVREALIALLPASYGVATGCLVNAQGERSLPVDIILYDRTILSELSVPDEALYDVRQTLLTIQLAYAMDETLLQDALRTVASIKVLRAAAAKRATALKKLLPLSIVAFHDYATMQVHDQEGLSCTFDAALKRYDEALRPDYLIAVFHTLSYRNPLLSGDTFTSTTINITREPDMPKPSLCYVCKERFTRQHFFYTHICPACGDLNYQKRHFSADLTGRIALVTGGRIKIGYATALRLLRAGAHVIVTSRFPHDAVRRYSLEADFSQWQHRLQIYGLDLRNLALLQRFISHLHESYPALDILINNAAQTVRRPLAYYNHLLPFEAAQLADLPPSLQPLVCQSHELFPVPVHALDNPVLALTASQQAEPPVLSASEVLPGSSAEQLFENSWTKRIGEVDMTEFLEVQIINVTAPYMLVSQLRPLFCRSSFPRRFIINVSAVEGQFAQTKMGIHPHTNMAKAALNMLTHSAAADLAASHIFMNSVDPGWISLQTSLAERAIEEQRHLIPLDMLDAAARICDPIFMGIVTGQVGCGLLYKDYQPTAW